MLFIDVLNRLRMCVAIIFCDQAKKEHDQNQKDDLLFLASQNESLHSSDHPQSALEFLGTV